jgi:hypothetical protein
LAVDPLSMSAEDQAEIHRAQRYVQVLLRTGLGVAVAMLVAGMSWKLASGVHRAGAVRLFGLGDADSGPDLLMALGVLALAVTPAFRVLALVVIWSRERDWRFVGVATVVVLTLALAVVVGHG